MKSIQFRLILFSLFLLQPILFAQQSEKEIIDAKNKRVILFHQIGQYTEAIFLAEEVLARGEKFWGRNHANVADYLNNLAFMYSLIGVFEKAEPLYKRSLNIRIKELSHEDSLVAQSYNNLAGLYYKISNYQKAVTFFKNALGILEKQPRPNHRYIAGNLNNLGLTYQGMGLYFQADSLYRRVLEIHKVNLKNRYQEDIHPTLNNLGLLYEKQGFYTKAETFHKRALAIIEKKLGKEHPDYARSLYYLFFVWAATDNLDQIKLAANYLAESEFKFFHSTLHFLSENEQLKFIRQSPVLRPLWPSLYLRYGAKYDELSLLVSQVLTNNKGVIFEILTARSRASTTGDKDIRILSESLNDIRAQLSNAYFANPEPGKIKKQRVEFIQSLKKRQRILEDELSRKGYIGTPSKSPITYLQINDRLAEQDVLIDFWYFRKNIYDETDKNGGKPHYIAIIYQSNRHPELINLGEASTIDKSISELRAAIISTGARNVRPLQPTLQNTDASVKGKGKQLWRQLFKPLLLAIGDKKKIIICADGLLYYLPFGIMVDEQNRYLVEGYQFHYVSTSREIVQWGKDSGSSREAVIIADPKFDFDPSQQVASAGSKSFGLESFTRRSREWRQMGFGPLKYTGPEAVAIDSLLKQKGIPARMYLQEKAQESVLKNVEAPQILHISTHGFFLPDQQELRQPKEIGGFSSMGEFDLGPAIENPLLRSGLAFAGANHAESVKEGEDGLVTALEISGLDLQGTDLVTLSACLTGFGELKSGEGVYGLHRAFLLAGAKTVLASLWSVPDLETKDLMVEFYRQYLSSESISKSEALRSAQLRVIQDLRAKYGAAHPAYWGAFICIGER